VLVTHGISIRVLLARYFRYSIDQFSMLANPRNCEMVILGHDGAGKLQLMGRCELKLEEKESDDDDDDEDGRVEVVGYDFHRRLRILPSHVIQRLSVRISPDDVPPPSSSSIENPSAQQPPSEEALGEGSKTVSSTNSTSTYSR